MADFPALPLWTDAYLADTGHLSDEEHGMYLRLLMTMWRTPGCRVPNDDEWLSRRFADVEKLRKIVSEFCKSDGNWITQKRLRREWRYCQKTSRSQSDRAKSRWKNNKTTSRKGIRHQSGINPASDGHQSGNAPTPTPTPTKKDTSSLRSDVRRTTPKTTPRSELESVLDADHADAVIEHRKAKRAKLTAHAAHLLAGKFAQCPDPNAAADAMIAGGWQGFEPAWLENRSGQRAPPVQSSGIVASARRVIYQHRSSENGALRDGREGTHEAKAGDAPPLPGRRGP